MKIGVGREDQLYEELTYVMKVADVLQTVSNKHSIHLYVSLIITGNIVSLTTIET